MAQAARQACGLTEPTSASHRGGRGGRGGKLPRSHPDGFSVNARCLDPGTVEEMTVEPFNGREWEKRYPKGRGEYKDR